MQKRGTVLEHITSPQRDLSSSEVSIPVYVLCYALDRIFVNSLKPLGQLKPNYMWNHHVIGEKMES